MMVPRHRHALVHLGDYAYAIGGIITEKQHSFIVERFSFNTKGWEFVASMKFERQFPKACVSTNTNRIFVFGGCASNDHNSVVEVYDCHKNTWSILGETTTQSALVLKEPF